MKTLLALEPRILFDGAALATGGEVAQDQTAQDPSIPGTDADAATYSGETMGTDRDASWSNSFLHATPTDRREIVFIDTRVEDYQTIMQGIHPAAEVILLDARRDGIVQISEELKDRSDIDAIHLIGEGTEAEMHLGTAFLTNESISGHYAALLSQIGQSLSADADLLIYGCNFGRGQAGFTAIQILAELTGADIAASTDQTGHVSEYANWELEVSTGFIETSIVIREATQEAWEGVLATYTVTTTTDGGAGSLRQAIINANANAGTDTITFVGSGTYLLTIAGTGEDAAATGDLDITDNLIIIGNGPGNTVIDASGFGVDGVVHLLGTNTATISGVTIQGGTANDGGGIFVDGSSILNLTDAIVQNNTSDLGGGLHVHGTANVNRVLFFNNSSTVEGGAIHFHGADGGSLTNITVTGNTSGIDGGGLWTDTSITITNSTFTLNHANNDGGGIVADAGTITISNTIVSDNTATTANPDVDGNFSSNGFNLIKDITGGTGFGSDISGVSANLGGLADNGGPTRTHALLAGSPALNAGTTSGAPAVDQRGITRDAVPDIGAFEYTASPFVSKSEFMVNDPSGNNEQTSGPVRGAERAVDIAPNGDYVVVWTNGTSNDKVFAKALDSGGNEKVAQFQVNIGGGTNAWTDVAVDDSGNFLVTWTQGGDIFMRRFLANGTAVDAGDLIVNTGTSTTQQNPSVNMNGAGDFVIAWEGDGGGNEGIFVRRGSMGGGLTGSDITANTAGTAKDPSVGIADSGGFVVVWDNGSDVFFQLYNSGGVSQNSGQVDVLLQLSAGAAAVDMSGDGRFTVAYRATILDEEVYVRQFDAAGNALFLPKIANTSGLLTTQTNPSITMDDIGEFIVVWEGAGNRPGQNDTAGVFGQKFNSSGQKIGVEFLINQTTANVQDRASVAMLDRDNFVAVWTGSDGAQTDIFARQYGATTSPTLDLDANNSSGATGNDYAFTFTEGDGPTAIADSDTDLADVDSTAFAYVTVSLSGLLDGNAEVLILDGDTFALATDAPGQDTTGGNYHVRVSTAAGTAIVTIIKQGGGIFSEIETETLIQAIQYQHLDTDAPSDGDRLIEVKVNDGTTDSAAARTTVNINPVNDAPSVATNTGTTVNEASTGTVLTTAMLNEGDPDDAGIGLTYTVTAVTTNGTLRLSGTALGLNDTFTQDDIDTNRVTYDHNGSETTTDSFSFSLADGGENGAVPATGTFSLTITPANDPPVFNGLDNAPTFIEGGVAVVLDNNATIADTDLDAANNYNGATLTLVRNGGGNAEDLFNGSGTLLPLVESGNLRVGITTIGTVTTNSGGTLLLTFNSNATTGLVNTALQQLTYANNSDAPPPSVQINFTITDGNAGGQGSGGTLNDTGFITVSINAINNPPIAVPDSLVVNEGSSTTLNLAGNDLDLDDGLDLTSITIVSGPTNGTITSINTNGAVDYTHDGSETLTDSFTYTIRDLAGAISNTVAVSLTVTPVNDAPIMTSNGGGPNANISVITSTTGVTDVEAIDVEGATPIYSIVGGADAALFRIDPATGVLTFITAPDFRTPGDAGGDNIYDVIVQASDGTAVDTQAMAVTVTQANVPPQIFIPPPPDPPSSSDPPPRDAGEETSEDHAPANGGSLDPSLPGTVPEGGQGPTINGSRDTDPGNSLGKQDLPAKQQKEKPTGIVEMVNDMLDFFQKPFDITVFKDEIRSLLTRHGFLQDLDRVRDSVQDIAATEKTYLASSIAVSSGLSIGYVVWLLRSGVLLTALLSSVPAWQFVNPLLVLDAAAKKKRQKGQRDVKEDSVESLFEKPTASTELAKEKTGNPGQATRPRWFRWNRP